VDGDRRPSPGVNGLDDLGVADALEIDGRDPEVAVAELALDDHERYAFVGEFDRVRMSQLVRGKAAAHAGDCRRIAQLRASGRDRPAATARRAGDDAEQRPDRELEPSREPRLQLLPCLVVHAALTPVPAPARTHQHRATPPVQIGLSERKRLADPKRCAPQHDDWTTKTLPCSVFPAARITATISSTVGGTAG
jgi:hypothetical protein